MCDHLPRFCIHTRLFCIHLTVNNGIKKEDEKHVEQEEKKEKILNKIRKTKEV